MSNQALIYPLNIEQVFSDVVSIATNNMLLPRDVSRRDWL
ncbi:hypothetical protein VIMY103929_06680 [Vibrio mytili]